MPPPGKMDIVGAEFAGRGFEPEQFLMSMNRFGVPHDLRRLLAVYIKSGVVPAIDYARRSVMDMLETLKKLVSTAMRSPPSARDLLTLQPALGEWDYVEGALQKALKQDPNQGAKKDWVQARQRIYVAMGLRWGTVSASRLSTGSDWWPTLKAAERDALAL